MNTITIIRPILEFDYNNGIACNPFVIGEEKIVLNCDEEKIEKMKEWAIHNNYKFFILILD